MAMESWIWLRQITGWDGLRLCLTNIRSLSNLRRKYFCREESLPLRSFFIQAGGRSGEFNPSDQRCQASIRADIAEQWFQLQPKQLWPAHIEGGF